MYYPLFNIAFYASIYILHEEANQLKNKTNVHLPETNKNTEITILFTMMQMFSSQLKLQRNI